MEASAEESYEVVGVMSGSSLDGLDLAWCQLRVDQGRWTYNVREARTVPYDAAFRTRLVAAMDGSAVELARLHRDLGRLIGTACRELVGATPLHLIASHGHTLFHRPEEGLTMQVGCGAQIAAVSGITTVCDFRTVDVALGGQGAPLVPLGERLLFPEHRAFLNIGGICNIALHAAERVVGYDVCIGNQALNELAGEAGLPYDADGAMARSGRVDAAMVAALSALPFHQQPPPRSLGRDWYGTAVHPLIVDERLAVEDRLASVVEHIAQQVSSALKDATGPVLVTGGGAHNTYLLERLRALCNVALEVPDARTVDYKEALIFALLGVSRTRGEANALSSVTGAGRNSVGGAVYAAN
ncbi:MAG: anhydro-N-acetylmuramic acid kinase [Flavobacteriales bacterium]|nr:anhydro-N-acetylmuramic acid kinase [Flavobacteriales bacterium]